MIKGNICSLINICFALLSCFYKNEYPKKYSRFDFAEGEVKMYSKTGAVNDRQTMGKFAERTRNHFLNPGNGTGYVYSFNEDVNEFANYNLEITLLSETEGELTLFSANPGETAKLPFDLGKKGYHYVLSMRDTIVSFAYQENPRYKCKPRIISHKPLPGIGERVRCMRPLFIKMQKNEIRISIISYMKNNYLNGGRIGIAISDAANNLISEEFLASLGQTAMGRVDTIAFKESFIIFK